MAFGAATFGGTTFGGIAPAQAAPTVEFWKYQLKKLYPDSHNVDGPVYSALLGAIGWMLDRIDPFINNLPAEFSVTLATGSALDANGLDWGILRNAGESDASYRSRILASLLVYADGATLSGISGVIQTFTGTAPVIVDGSTSGWRFGSSVSPTDTWGSSTTRFQLRIYIQNSGGGGYSHLAMENAIRRVLPARSSAIVYHNGADTSSLGEASNAIVTIVG